ncbi:MAG: hypothetical protein IJ242_11170 [Clostridia bacterium]|nr:hypothetical protein [Clostridia bacterium]
MKQTLLALSHVWSPEPEPGGRTNPEEREQKDIDVIGLDKMHREAVIGECKFKHEISDRKVFKALKVQHKLLHENYRVVQLLLSSASEFLFWLTEEDEGEL